MFGISNNSEGPCQCVNCWRKNGRRINDSKQQPRVINNNSIDTAKKFRSNKSGIKTKNINNKIVENPQEFTVAPQEFLENNVKERILEDEEIDQDDFVDLKSKKEHSSQDKSEDECIKEKEDNATNSENSNVNNDDYSAINIEAGENNSDDSETDDNEKEIEKKLMQIESIKNKVKNLAVKVDDFVENTKKKDFLCCEEMLVKCLLELDSILANGEETIRKARKSVISDINDNIFKLESKLNNRIE